MTAAIIAISRVLLDDDTGDMPDEHDEGFWPSNDPDACGYVLPENFDAEQAKAEQRMSDFNDGAWRFIGVIARAEILEYARIVHERNRGLFLRVATGA